MSKDYGTRLKDGMASGGYVGYGASYAPPGEKADQKVVQLHARFVDMPDRREAQLCLSVMNVYEKAGRRTELAGGIDLAPADAKALALAIAPPEVKRAVDSHAELVAALKMAKEFEQHAGGTHMGAGAWFKLHETIDAALAAAGETT